MSTRPFALNPWPVQTPVPLPFPESSSLLGRSPKRRRISDTSSSVSPALERRQVIVDQGQIQQASYDCEVNSGNDVVSCFPTADSVFAQGEWATFVWNSRLPNFTQTNSVNIFLVRADSRQEVLQFLNVSNPLNQAGLITAQVNDSWWGAQGSQWNGKNVSFPFYWIMQRSDKSIEDGAIPQATFTAVQTTFADSVIASRSSASAAAASSSAAMASLSSIEAGTSTISRSGSSSPSGTPGSVQATSGSSDFPHWAIAVIVVLGFLAICASGTVIFFIIRKVRRNREYSNRNSVGSNSPMMANAAQQQSPLLGAAVLPGFVGAANAPSGAGTGTRDAPSVVMHDGASTVSRAGSAGDSGPFSGADAAIMADAFRKMLRKPDFADRPVEEGESPENPEQKEEIINRELAEEGRDIRSVGSSRGVKVETLSDSESRV